MMSRLQSSQWTASSEGPSSFKSSLPSLAAILRFTHALRTPFAHVRSYGQAVAAAGGSGSNGQRRWAWQHQALSTSTAAHQRQHPPATLPAAAAATASALGCLRSQALVAAGALGCLRYHMSRDPGGTAGLMFNGVLCSVRL